MGNICCDGNEQSKKASFVALAREDVMKPYSSNSLRSSIESAVGDGNGKTQDGEITSLKLQQAQTAAENERKRREEQTRLDHIVSTTGRDMVSLYGRRGASGGSTSFRTKSQGPIAGGASIAYYDSTYASVAARDIYSNDALSRILHSLYDDDDDKTESGQSLDVVRRKKIMDILRGKIPTIIDSDENSVIESSSKRIDWKELIRNVLPVSLEKTSSGLDSMFLNENGIESDVLFQGLEPLIENLP